MNKIVILGSTGSIGTQCLDVLEKWGGQAEVLGLSSNRNLDLLNRQIRQHQPKQVALMCPEAAQKAREVFSQGPEILEGIEGLEHLATLPEANTIVSATVGAVGLRPTLAAIRKSKKVALANKEVLVMAGQLVMQEVLRHDAVLLPIDSEHSAILQCLAGGRKQEVRRVLITASGGPFRTRSLKEMESITVGQALDHPTWNMGPKITIDSATMMNKGLEIIEAYHLFGLPLEQIEVVVHPQSIVHSMVEFVDGSIIAQLSSTDMRVPIQYALSYPERYGTHTQYLNLSEISRLTFEEPDMQKFPCLELAYESIRLGGTAPAVLSVANEVAVEAFLHDKIGFMDIPKNIEQALNRHQVMTDADLETILSVEQETRQQLESELLA